MLTKETKEATKKKGKKKSDMHMANLKKDSHINR